MLGPSTVEDTRIRIMYLNRYLKKLINTIFKKTSTKHRKKVLRCKFKRREVNEMAEIRTVQQEQHREAEILLSGSTVIANLVVVEHEQHFTVLWLPQKRGVVNGANACCEGT